MKIALAQIDCAVGDFDGNLKKIIQFSVDAKKKGASIVVFPEMALTGYPVEDLALRRSFLEASKRALNFLVARSSDEDMLDLMLVIGTLSPTKRTPDANRVAIARNSAYAILNGEIITKYDKHLLPNTGVFDEYRVFEEGTSEGSFKLNGERFQLFICADIWNLEQISDRVKATNKDSRIDHIIVINASPFEVRKQSTRYNIARQLIHGTDISLTYVNMVGGQDDLVFDGASFCMFRGKVFARAKKFREELLVVDIEKNNSPTQENFALHSESYDTESIYRALVLGLRDYVQKNGFTEVVLGLSGGIDSALCAVIAKDAVGAKNVMGILMPSKFSSKSSIDDALETVNLNGFKHCIQSIEPIYDAYVAELRMSSVAQENIQARIRGNILMNYANTNPSALVIATGNKSELAVGYSTIYGDAVGGFAPIKDVLKSKVYELAVWRNGHEFEKNNGSVIPKNSITKPPSAELRADQKDQDSLPDYAVLDAMLELYVENAHGKDELINAGYDRELVEEVVRMVDRAEWKRRQYPPGPKVSALAFGRDRRLPITSRF
ncbi:MAG: NAD+ synthase [Bifidobacteriaceae bacterium]|jgi:NAD+ synthase (glutamine-hydrolysing)|nr:NAD+ synthase [Bifidobacteriaceae bacterium]